MEHDLKPGSDVALRPRRIEFNDRPPNLVNPGWIDLGPVQTSYFRRAEFIHNPYRFCSFDINNYYNQEHIV